MNSSPRYVYGVVVLAAGASVRMGRQKLLLPWGNSTVITHIIRQWKDLASMLAVVIRSDAGPEMRDELERAGVPPQRQIVNHWADRGMFSSIQAAARWPHWPGEITHVVVVLGDQPHLDRAQVLEPLLQAVPLHAATVVQPSFGGKPKHPVVLPRSLFNSLAESEHATLREALAGMPVLLVPVSDPLASLDLDTPGDYEYATRIVFGGKP